MTISAEHQFAARNALTNKKEGRLGQVKVSQ